MTAINKTIYQKGIIFLESKTGFVSLMIASLFTLISQSYFLIANWEKNKIFFLLCGMMSIAASIGGLYVAFQRAKKLNSERVIG